MKVWFVCLGTLLLFACPVLAAQPLTDAQMDGVTGGALVCTTVGTSTSCITDQPLCANLPGGSCASQVFTSSSRQLSGIITDLTNFLNTVGFKPAAQ